MTIDGVKRSAQQQVNRALKDHARFDTLHLLSSYSCLAHHFEQSIIFYCENCDVILHATWSHVSNIFTFGFFFITGAREMILSPLCFLCCLLHN